MPVTDAQIVWLGAHLAGDLDEVQRVNAEATAPEARAGIGALLHAAFVIAARRKFAADWTGADITQFVARVRGLLSDQPDALDPTVAEQELRTALGEKHTGQPEAKSRGRSEFILLNALVQSLDLNRAETADLLGQARSTADDLLQ